LNNSSLDFSEKPLFNEEIVSFLNQKVKEFNAPDFIQDDPISIPHLFTKKEDIEIAGFLAALLSWGQRKTILSKSKILLSLMDNQPYDFLISAEEKDFLPFNAFVHRTLNGNDTCHLINALSSLYQSGQTLESLFMLGYQHSKSVPEGITAIRSFILSFPKGTSGIQRHLSDPQSGSAAKRMCMFLRWMVRKDTNGVDFGIWKGISPSQLYCPLDIHSGRVGRLLGLLNRKQNDWKAVEELTTSLRLLDADDPVKYDFALFGIGVNEGFS